MTRRRLLTDRLTFAVFGRLAAGAVSLALFACDKAPAPTTAPDAGEKAATSDEGEAAPAEPTEEEKLAKQRDQMAARLADALEKAKKKYEKEVARWQEQGLEAKVQKLADTKYKNLQQGLKKILASPHREPGNADRDQYRHPAETLKFFGLTPKMTVVEAGPGTGWYTEILAPLLAKQGKLVVPVFDPAGPDYEFTTFLGKRVGLMLDKSAALYGKVERVTNSKYEAPSFGPDGSADLVLVTREMHNWWRNGVFEGWLGAAHAVLAPGGTLAIVQHRAAEGANPDESSQKGYLPEEWLIEQVEAVGFRLVDASEINANAKDTKDYEGGVWTLPPVLARGDEDREKYQAIGESDRMTLKFEKTE
jgi:predicted methyltransferase